MVDFFNRMLYRDSNSQLKRPEPLTNERIETGYRLFWTKMALQWDAERRAEVAAAVAAAIAAPEFEGNALERRFTVPEVDTQAHSGASLVALAEVLRALDAYDAAYSAADDPPNE